MWQIVDGQVGERFFGQDSRMTLTVDNDGYLVFTQSVSTYLWITIFGIEE